MADTLLLQVVPAGPLIQPAVHQLRAEGGGVAAGAGPPHLPRLARGGGGGLHPLAAQPPLPPPLTAHSHTAAPGSHQVHT